MSSFDTSFFSSVQKYENLKLVAKAGTLSISKYLRFMEHFSEYDIHKKWMKECLRMVTIFLFTGSSFSTTGASTKKGYQS